MYTEGKLNFRKDLVSGEKGEGDIRTLLESLGFIFISDNKDNKYDLLMEYGKKRYTYEVKTDIYKDTGNMAIEFECRGKASGIAVTQADYFVYYYAHLGEAWNIKISDLKWIIENHDLYVPKGGGDKGSNTLMYLIKREKFRKYFKVHKV